MSQSGSIKIHNAELKNFTYDRAAKSAYFQFSDNKVAKTVEHAPDLVNIDFDKDGCLVGIEFMGFVGIKKMDKGIFVQISNIYNIPEVKRVPKILHELLPA